MSYTPTNWQDGDLITAEKLNHLEGGVADGGGDEPVEITFWLQTTGYFSSASHTVEEVQNLIKSGKRLIAKIKKPDQSDVGGECMVTSMCSYYENYSTGAIGSVSFFFYSGSNNMQIYSFQTPDGWSWGASSINN